MKKLTIILIIVALLLAGGIAAALGYVWYRDNHIFVDDAVYDIDATELDLRGQEISFEHYDILREELPDCKIYWDVPFQGEKYSNDITSLTVSSLTEEDIQVMGYFAQLEQVNAEACDNYAILEVLQAVRQECKVVYKVDIGGTSWAPDTTALELSVGDYDYNTLLENLKYLPNVTDITLRMPELTREEIDAVAAAREGLKVSCTVGILGQEYALETTELNLSALTSEQVAEVTEKLVWLPGLEKVDLMDENGESALTKEDVKLLQQAAPDAVFHYSFDFFGHTLTTTDEEVHIRNTRIGDAGEEEIRLTLDIMENCSRFVLEHCSVSNEVMAQLRDDYRGKTKLVWRVYFGKGSSLTDATAVRVVGDLVDDNCHDLVYLENVRYADFGHNEFLDSCDFVAGMKDLEVIIISGAPIKSLEPFANCKNLRVLEIAFCEYIEDLTPLASCPKLERLNIGNTHALDLSPLDDLPLTHLMARIYPSGRCRIPTEEQTRFQEANPDCQAFFTGAQPYGEGWRYDDNGDELAWYQSVRNIFKYDAYPNCPNHSGFYLDESKIVEE